ncbi:hypothetical protein LUZ62_090141 [Rhynchospora pubera]|uniref:F-box domain-containing protein n=1 Tax=Rhynchospora pubera TaxID=906938 RepID=A0AAV8CK12_9POAL|nr:hypothetical protein LUZ62_090141 [Rhynchospora pubera]
MKSQLPIEAPQAPVQPEQDAANIPLDDDLLAEIFRRFDNVASLIRCLQVCKRFYHVISSILRTEPFFLGFYHVPNSTSPRPRRLPQYIHTEPHFTNPNLNLVYLNSKRSNMYSILETRSSQVLLQKMVHGPDLHFVLASPFRRSSETIELPPRLFDARIHRLIVCSYVPWTQQPNEEYKVVVVFSDRPSGALFTVMGFSSLAHKWTSVSHNQNGRITFPKRAGYQEGLEPTVFASRMVYKLQNGDYILAVDPSTLLLSKIDLPVTDRSLLCYGNHFLGRTEEDNLCFFLMRKMDLFMWVYRVNNNVGGWFLHEIVDLNGLMDPHAMGEVATMRFSANMLDQLKGFRLVTLNGFGEGSGVLILVMADWVISYNIKSKRLERLWYSHDWATRVQAVYAYEMVWPPAPMLPLGGQQSA